MPVVLLLYKFIDLRELALDEGANKHTEDAPGDQIEKRWLSVVEDKHYHNCSYDGDQVTNYHRQIVVLRG